MVHANGVYMGSIRTAYKACVSIDVLLIHGGDFGPFLSMTVQRSRGGADPEHVSRSSCVETDSVEGHSLETGFAHSY